MKEPTAANTVAKPWLASDRGLVILEPARSICYCIGRGQY